LGAVPAPALRLELAERLLRSSLEPYADGSEVGILRLLEVEVEGIRGIDR